MVIIAPVYEKEQAGVLYNTAAVIDADGTYLGKYRKNHIPHTSGFWEKFFFKKPRVQRATARLEESGLVTRTFVATSLVRDAKIAKELTLKLNHAKLLTLVEDCEVDL